MKIDIVTIESRKRLGSDLSRLMSQHDMTQKSLSELSCVGAANITRIIQGRFSPTIDTYDRLLRPFGLKLGFVKLPTQLDLFEEF